MKRSILLAVACLAVACREHHTAALPFRDCPNDTLLVYTWPEGSASASLRRDTTDRSLRNVLHKLADFRHLIESKKKDGKPLSTSSDEADFVPTDWDSLGSYYVSLGQDVGRFFSHPIEEIRERREARERTAQDNRMLVVAGMPAPPLRLPTARGGEFALDFNRGECTVLLFWSGRCRPCMEDMPAMKRAWDRYHGRVYFIGIGCDESRKAWKNAVRRYALPWLNLYDDTRTNVSARYGVETYPTKFIIDRNGIILVRVEDNMPRFYARLDSLMAVQQPPAAR